MYSGRDYLILCFQQEDANMMTWEVSCNLTYYKSLLKLNKCIVFIYNLESHNLQVD